MKLEVVVAWALASALRMPIEKDPSESPEERRARVEVIARSMVLAAREHATGKGWSWTEITMAGLRLWNEESRFSKIVHEGGIHPRWTQDEGRARCLGQLHKSRLVPLEEWSQLAGTSEGSTLQCARATLLVLTRQAAWCGVWYGQRADRRRVAMTLAAYGSGGKCEPTDSSWRRANAWEEGMRSRPDRPTVPGFRRVALGGVPEPVLSRAREVAEELKAGRRRLGERVPVEAGGKAYLLLVEPHAGGKTGVSVLEAAAPR